ncbi:unnamed protein product [Pleuronectes platessa]|uniref:Uncharacterized protein n=1 Tax=Pleuronectes platessa TaxID=8262 RepID=A0A9N7UIL3_PLEPL|nr:unnamed protein product [Pleuronectes platessa]
MMMFFFCEFIFNSTMEEKLTHQWTPSPAGMEVVFCQRVALPAPVRRAGTDPRLQRSGPPPSARRMVKDREVRNRPRDTLQPHEGVKRERAIGASAWSSAGCSGMRSD